jgi:hypothetical protein
MTLVLFVGVIVNHVLNSGLSSFFACATTIVFRDVRPWS